MATKNKSFPVGGIILIEKVEKEYKFFSEVFQGLGGEMKSFIPLLKLHIYNRLAHVIYKTV